MCHFDFPCGSAVKESTCNAGDTRDAGLFPGLGKSPGEGNGSPPQYFAWRTPWTEEPGRLPSTELQKVDITEHTHRGAARWRFCIIKQGMGSGHELLCPFLISTCSPTWEPSEPSPFRILGRLHYTGTIDEVIGDGRLTQLPAPLPSLEAVGLKVATL